MTNATNTTPLCWHADTRLLGVRVQAYFFDPAQINPRASFGERYLPVFARARLCDNVLCDDVLCDDLPCDVLLRDGDTTVHGSPRPSFVVGDLSGQADAVLEHGNGLLCLTYRPTQQLFLERGSWPAQVRVDAMLQSIASAMAVAGVRQLPAAALMRFGNALLMYSPGPPVLECLASSIGAARRYWNAPRAVSAAQLAAFCEPRLRALPGMGATASSLVACPTALPQVAGA